MTQRTTLPQSHQMSRIDLMSRTVIVTGMLVAGAMSIMHIVQNFSTHWYWLVLATVYTITINETFCHRICSHNLFAVNVDSLTYKIFTWLVSADLAHGPVRSATMWHRAHHIYSDQGRADPVNVKEFWFGLACAMPFRGWFRAPEIPQPQKILQQSYLQCRDIIDDPWTQFCEQYATIIAVINLSLMYWFLPTVLFNVVLTGRALLVLMFLLIGLCHHKNVPGTYRHVNTPDNSNNNLLFHYVFLGLFGGFLQNNHHSRPNSMSMGRTWYEIDTSTPIAYLLRFMMEKK